MQDEQLKKDNDNFENMQRRHEQTFKRLQNVYFKKSNKQIKQDVESNEEVKSRNEEITDLADKDQNKRIKGE